MSLLKKEVYFEKNGVCTFYEFANELSYDELIAVNGGCGGGSAYVTGSDVPPLHDEAADCCGVLDFRVISHCGGGIFVYKVSENSVPLEFSRGANGPYILPIIPENFSGNEDNLVSISQEDREYMKTCIL